MTTTLTAQYGSLPVATRGGSAFRLACNAWNYPAYTDEQAITNDDGRPSFTITKSAANDPSRVLAFPNLWRGGALFTADHTPGSFMPCRLDTPGPILSSWSTSQLAEPGSKWNTTYDIWVADSWPGGHRTAEIMIMLTYPFIPDGAARAPRLGGLRWYVTQRQAAGRAGESWRMIQFRLAPQSAEVHDLDLAEFFAWTIGQGWASPSDLLIQVAAGFELWVGGAGLATNWLTVEQW